ncbi:MAG: hypothetical protein JXR37_06970 [Kiritimatiellae bacterium]|nr:hypothetical protein [Kiritimatiellia bacterium]
MSENAEQDARRRRPYEKPQLRKIELAAEEVLGGDCKLPTGGIAFGAVPCPANGCELGGS